MYLLLGSIPIIDITLSDNITKDTVKQGETSGGTPFNYLNGTNVSGAGCTSYIATYTKNGPKTYKEDGIYYEDLYLDVLYYQESVTKDSTYIQLDDLKELNDALECNDITKNQYDKAYTTAETIMKELRYDSNKYVNRGLIDYYKFKTSVN